MIRRGGKAVLALPCCPPRPTVGRTKGRRSACTFAGWAALAREARSRRWKLKLVGFYHSSRPAVWPRSAAPITGPINMPTRLPMRRRSIRSPSSHRFTYLPSPPPTPQPALLPAPCQQPLFLREVCRPVPSWPVLRWRRTAWSYRPAEATVRHAQQTVRSWPAPPCRSA